MKVARTGVVAVAGKEKRFHPSPKAARERISAKISHLISSGEAKSRKQAVAIAHSMEKRGELGPKGGKKR